ncbi:MAG: hypothetical protein JWN08_380, partial [Frankiales bacterium]|nr:hypothetical protein [Frankiales bacterium]
MRFKRKRSGAVVAEVDRIEADLLSAMAGDLLALLGADDEDAAEQDPLAALVGLSAEPVERPEDPALARLLPDAYGDDEQAAAEFRRYTDADLRAGKRAQARTVLGGLTGGT